MARRVAKKNTFFKNFMLFLFLVFVCYWFYFTYKTKIDNYLFAKREIILDKNITKQNLAILNHHNDKVFGIDISEYQGRINWDDVVFLDKNCPINFVFVRATVGKDRVDNQFKKNWIAADKKFIRGAYHYYRPNENSIEQANLFIKTVLLEKGDFPPVLDIEKLPKNQSIDSLKIGLKRWLTKVENHYGVKPIIYSGDKYFSDFLEDEFSDYIFWIAHYDFFENEINSKWKFWQFTEKSRVVGIRGNVDLNIFNGNIGDLKSLTLD